MANSAGSIPASGKNITNGKILITILIIFKIKSAVRANPDMQLNFAKYNLAYMVFMNTKSVSA